jgi:hypothetical protein
MINSNLDECDGCGDIPVKLYQRFFDGVLWLCESCVKETDEQTTELEFI